MSEGPRFLPKPRKRKDGTSVEIPLDLLFWSLMTRLDGNFGGLLLSYLATQEKIDQLARTKWYDERSDRFDNKMRMKELGGAVFSYSDFLVASTLQSLSNIIEDTWIEMRRDVVGFKYDVWRPSVLAENEHAARVVRAVANVLKHNQGVLDSKSSEHAKFLVNESGLTDGYEVTLFAQGETPKIDPLDLIYRCYLYCVDLGSKVYGCRNWSLEIPDGERKRRVLDDLVPRVSDLRP